MNNQALGKKQKISMGIGWVLSIAYLFLSLFIVADTPMFILAIIFSLLGFLDEARVRSYGFAIGWVATIMGTCLALFFLGNLWSPVGFAVGYLLVGWFVVPRLEKLDM